MSSSGWSGEAENRRVPAGYRWVRTIRSGPSGVVQLAHDDQQDRPVAVELLPSAAPDQLAQLARESALATSLGHPHILPVLASGGLDGAAYLVTPYVDGPDLDSRIAAGPLPWPAVLQFLAPVADALDTAHRAGLVHRGVGPGAVLLGPPSDVPVLRGFGIAPAAGYAGSGEAVDHLAPEQILGGPVDQRTDVYALGALVHHCLTGRAPFARADPGATMAAHVNEPPPRVTEQRPDLPWAIDDVVAMAMAKDPARRFAGCRPLIDAAAAALGAGPVAFPSPQRPPARSRRGPVLIGLGVVVVLVAAAVFAVPPIVASFRPAAAELDRVPVALRDGCDYAGPDTGLAGATRVLGCRDGSGQDVSVSLFDSDAASDAAYRGLAAAATGARSGDGDCADGPGWEHRYPEVGTARGRVLCDRDAGAVRMAWLDRPARSVSSAVRSDGNALELYRSWTSWVALPAFPSPPEQELLGLLPETGCRSAKAGGLETLEGLVAAVTCPPISTGASSVTYYRFADAESLRRAYAADVVAAGSPPATFCVDRSKPEVTAGNTGFVRGPVTIGQVLCGNASGSPTITWTADPLLIMGRAGGADRTELVAWWNGYSGPKTEAVIAASNKAASPPFPNAQEDTLLKRLPPPLRPTCQRVSEKTLADFDAEKAIGAVECGPDTGPTTAYYFQFEDAFDLAATITREATGADCTTSPPAFDGIARYRRTNGSTGILLCFQDEVEAGIGWTDDQANIFAAAFGPSPSELITWWQDEADPL